MIALQGIPLKNEHRVAINVRLNLNKPSHRQAWERLQSRHKFYSETCIAAINAMTDSKDLAEVKRAIGGIVREVVAAALRQIPMTMVPAVTDKKNNDGILYNDGLDIADEFMNSL